MAKTKAQKKAAAKVRAAEAATTAEVKTVAEAQNEEDELNEELKVPPAPEVIEPEPKTKGKILTPLDTEEGLDEPVNNFQITPEIREGFQRADEEAAKRSGRKGPTVTQLARKKRGKKAVFTKREAMERYRLQKARVDSPRWMSPELKTQAEFEVRLFESGNWSPGRDENNKLTFQKAPSGDRRTRELVKSIMAGG